MFLYNVNWQWNLFSQSRPHGVLFQTIGVDQDTAKNRTRSDEFPGIALLDPNVYFWNLDYEECGHACRNLSTYDFVPIAVPPFSGGKRKEWLDDIVGPIARQNWPPNPNTEEAIRESINSCCELQREFGVYRLILPTPHISHSSDNLDQFQSWLDLGLEISRGFKIPSIVSLSLSESAIPKLYNSVLDQITARENILGVYICIETSRAEGLAPDNRVVASALLEASFRFGRRAGMEVFINFADVFGLACLAVGATAFSSGYETKAKRLNFDDFLETESGGGAYPRFFSLATTKLYRAKSDLIKIRDKRLLRFFSSDKTSISSPLFDALASGQDANAVPAWSETRNNVAAARSHLIEILKLAADNINSITNPEDKIRWALEWLQNAESLNSYLEARFQEDELEAIGGHLGVWRAAFEEFISNL